MIVPVKAEENLASSTATTETKKETKKKVIVIDAGHQGKANLKKEAIGPGSKKQKYKVAGGATGVSTKKKESATNLEIAKKLKTELESRGYKVIMTRTSQKVNISNMQRAKIGNTNNADAVIHLHCDSSDSHSTKGAHTIAPKTNNPYVSKSVQKKCAKLAKSVIKSYTKKTGIKSKGVNYRNDLTGLNWTKVPSIYIEMGFLSNKSEDKKLNNGEFQKKCAKGIADGIDAYFK
jgi:N-acetylmuramoyl-L-alanine amidase